jgi:hypothetical protein
MKRTGQGLRQGSNTSRTKYIKKSKHIGHQWFIPAILVTQEAEIRKIPPVPGK